MSVAGLGAQIDDISGMQRLDMKLKRVRDS